MKTRPCIPLSFPKSYVFSIMKGVFLTPIYYLLISSFIPVAKSFESNESEPFRMRKINLLWQQAKRMGMAEERLNELYVELQRQDQDERKWKHQKQEGKDKHGEMEAVIRRNLLKIIDKYGLMGEGKDREPPVETGDHIETNRVQSGSFVRDERLEKLWEYAKSEAKFSKEELEHLRKELVHHHEKWQQYRDLVKLVSTYKDANIAGNNIPHDKGRISKLREEMNMQKQEVDSNYRRLKKKVSQQGKDGDFEDYRVRELWKRVQAQGLSDEELDIMKEELRHFDNKIAKHDHLQEQLDVAEDLLNQGHEHIKPKHEKLSAKVKQHRVYIKKLYATLDKKIGPHNEL